MLPKAEILLTEANGFFWREGLGKNRGAKNKKGGCYIVYKFGQMNLPSLHFMSTSKSSTSSFVSSVPFLLPTAHTSFVFEARIRHTTPPLPPLSNVTRFRINSPVFKSHSFTVPSSELVITKFLLNCKQVTAL